MMAVVHPHPGNRLDAHVAATVDDYLKRFPALLSHLPHNSACRPVATGPALDFRDVIVFCEIDRRPVGPRSVAK